MTTVARDAPPGDALCPPLQASVSQDEIHPVYITFSKLNGPQMVSMDLMEQDRMTISVLSTAVKDKTGTFISLIFYEFDVYFYLHKKLITNIQTYLEP